MKFGTLLRQYREEAGLSQQALAEKAGLTGQAISKHERGLAKPWPDTVRRLADALKLNEQRRSVFFEAARLAGDPDVWTEPWSGCRVIQEPADVPSNALEWTTVIVSTLADSAIDVLALPYAFMPSFLPVWVVNMARSGNPRHLARLLCAAPPERVATVLSRIDPVFGCRALSYMHYSMAWTVWSLMSEPARRAIAEVSHGNASR